MERALHNISILQFYSLIQVITRRLLYLQVHELIFAIIKKELEYTAEVLKKHSIWDEHDRMLSDSLIVLKRILLLPETAMIDRRMKEFSPSKLVDSLMPNLILILK